MSKPPATEQQFFADVVQILQAGRSQALRAVNTAMVQTYWQLGQRIVEEEQQGEARAEYGQALISQLSRYLGDQFGQGFSVANLKNFRQFYLTFPSLDEFATHCVANLGWTHVRLIMRLGSAAERNYYLQEASNQNWSSRLLERNIKSGYYRRVLAHQKPQSDVLPASDTASFIKDPYVLEFLGVPEDLSGKESLLEQSLINHLQKFLLELGKGFSFVARQMRISTETSHFYVDLVFYNYLLKCFVVVELKSAKLTHQDIGQMDMYVRMFDDLKRGEGDSPTLGIILCADKDETLVHYSVLRESQQLFASKYQTLLPTEEELAAMLEQETAKRLDDAAGDKA
ncbi:PDDEXK nuclease domain-containing protein [Thiomicrospira sp. R3]|uniref:PDDEXK nuclease domain-containing protein n=1 Tax=Thiomicrospira sp. R3 TaxID=3035472 RepID=UPI00259BC6EF|nr:PDDEXK nuclease domain-containing protein [Thiomicrospira sp. R3]WFE68606.1 PDDEXK nuclease domain-containing protein [Thiomicrospira sp. R3]